MVSAVVEVIPAGSATGREHTGGGGCPPAGRLARMRVRVGDVRLYFDVAGMGLVPDGAVGPNTSSVLDSEVAARSQSPPGF